ncbi:Ig-like domain-containing protein [Litoribrevibacter euphylliae]|uniref:Ig-like domain-containing protein n=1 Tax=Litoribrevibacter euphylliae TaxID=1834034 RepID=A0ABV7HDF1_9GAMM
MRRVQPKLYLPLALVSAQFLTACGGGGGGSSDSPNSTPTTPDAFLSSVTPAGNATGIELGATVEATFSKNLLASSIDQQSLTLQFDGQALNADITVDGTGKTLQAEPQAEMGLLCEYTATLSGDISDQEGNELGDDFTWRFTSRDGQWQTISTLSDQTDVFGTYLNELKLFNNGNAISIWSSEVGPLESAAYFKQYVNNQWQPTQQINSPGSKLNGGEFATNDRGDAFIVWREQDGTNYTLHGRHYNSTTEQWSAIEQIPGSSTNVDSRFEVTLSEDGIGYLAWSEENTANDYDLYVAKYQPGTGWQAEFSLEDNNNDDYAPRIAINNDDDIILMWRNIDADDPSNGDIHVRHFLSDGNGAGTWQTIIEFDVDASDNVTHSLTMNDEGHALVTWKEVADPQSNNSLYARYFDPNKNVDPDVEGSWGPINLIEQNPGLTGQVFASLDESGNTLVTWQQESDPLDNDKPTHLYANYYDVDDSAWLNNPVQLGTVSDTRTPATESSYLAMSSNGNAIVTWSYEDDGEMNLYSRYFTAQNRQWSNAQTVETTDFKFTSNKAIMDDQGHALAVWIQRTNGIDNIFVSRFNSYTQEWTDSTKLSNNPVYVRHSIMSTNTKGEALLLWEQGEGTNSTVLSRHFN